MSMTEAAAGGARTYGVTPLETMKAMSGLDFLRAILEGRLPAPPIAEAMNFGFREVEHGRVVFTGTPDFSHYNPIGSVHGGWFGTLLDSCMGCAVQSTLPEGTGYTTLEYKINLIRAVTRDTGPVTAEGRVIQAGRRVGVAEGRLTDGAGRLLAHGSTTCMIFPL